ncbi:MAG: hypothetical protein SNJ79_07035 [Sphingomonadaceae bacterium]
MSERERRTAQMDDMEISAALAHWAKAPVLDPAREAAAIARIVAHGDELASALPLPAATRRRRWWPMMAGGAVAASAALALLMAPPGPDVGTGATGAAPDMPEASFALLFTPTPDEEWY